MGVALLVSGTPGAGGDASCRWAGDLQGIGLDKDGNVHLSCVQEVDGKFLLKYTRQDPAHER
jgi:hypothetical protein